MFAKVVVDVKSPELDETFDYKIPEELAPFIFIGSRVLVSFGLRDVLGYVVDITDNSNFQENIKNIKEVYSFEQELTDDQVLLAKELAQELNCPLVNTLALMMPAFLKEQKRKTIHIEDPQALSADLAMVFQGKKKVTLDKSLDAYLPRIQQEIKRGTLSMGYEYYTYGKRKRVKCYRMKHQTPQKTAVRMKIIDYLVAHPDTPEEELVASLTVSVRLLRKMAQEGVIVYHEVVSLPQEVSPKRVISNPHFTFDQEQLFGQYLESDKKPFLLFSNHDSFKAQFYLKAIEANLEKGLLSVFLAPNILVVEELSAFIREHTHGVNSYTYHSKNSYSDNYEAYMSLKSNQCDVLVATPIGVFLPFQKVGSMFVVEEESSDFISENFPYYDARLVARRRMEHLKMKLVYTSAAPSLATYYQAMQNRIYLLDDHEVGKTYHTIVDMRTEVLEESNLVLSKTVLEEMRIALNEHKITLLIVNQKAFSTMIRCRNCGTVLKCPKCRIPLVVYEVKGIAKCNYCDYKTEQYHQCECGSEQMIATGFGMEQVASKVAFAFPEARILTLALDEQKKGDDYNQYLNALEEGEVDVVIGSYALTKSLHYDNIKVVALLYADSYLQTSDHRGVEYLYQLIAPITSKEVVIVQTYYPEHYAIRTALANDYDQFYAEEIKNRELLSYDPFVEINRVVVSGSTTDNFHFAYYFRKAVSHIPGVVVLGPNYDYRARGVKLLIKHNQFPLVTKVLRDAIKHFNKPELRISFERYPKGM